MVSRRRPVYRAFMVDVEDNRVRSNMFAIAQGIRSRCLEFEKREARENLPQNVLIRGKSVAVLDIPRQTDDAVPV